MKFAILAGGKGSRLTEITRALNKPLIPIGNAPLILHVAVRYLLAGAETIEILIGHESNRFKYKFEASLETLRKSKNTHGNLIKLIEQTKFNFVETDPDGDTFERIKPLLGDTAIMVTYGDTLTDVDVNQVIKFWRNYDSSYALTCVTRPKKRFSSITWDRNTSRAISFDEKKGFESSYVGCGFIVIPALDPSSELKDQKSLEKEILPSFVNENRLLIYEHRGFWHPIDYISDLEEARSLWMKASGSVITWLT